MIGLTVRFFALTRDLTGQSEVRLQLAAGATVATALSALSERFPALTPHMDRLAVAVDLEYVARTHPLQEGQELAIIPPVSGG